MPRQARLDVPGTLHHVIVRRISQHWKKPVYSTQPISPAFILLRFVFQFACLCPFSLSPDRNRAFRWRFQIWAGCRFATDTIHLQKQ